MGIITRDGLSLKIERPLKTAETIDAWRCIPGLTIALRTKAASVFRLKGLFRVWRVER